MLNALFQVFYALILLEIKRKLVCKNHDKVCIKLELCSDFNYKLECSYLICCMEKNVLIQLDLYWSLV